MSKNEMRGTKIYEKSDEYGNFLFDQMVFRYDPLNEEEVDVLTKVKEFIDEVLFINEGLNKMKELEKIHKRFHEIEA